MANGLSMLAPKYCSNSKLKLIFAKVIVVQSTFRLQSPLVGRTTSPQ